MIRLLLYAISAIAGILCAACFSGCASGTSNVTVNVPAGATGINLYIIPTITVSKPVDLQANGNDLSYAAAGGAAGLALGLPSGNPEAGLALGMIAGLTVAEVKDALTPAPAAKAVPASRYYLLIPTPNSALPIPHSELRTPHSARPPPGG